MSRPARIALAAAALAAAVGLFLLLRPSEEPAGDATATTQTVPAPTVSTPTPPVSGPTLIVKRVVIDVRDGRVPEGAPRLELVRGQRVQIVIRADAADEVHLHGYDIERAVAPGAPARVSFTADAEGIFELELHGTGQQLANVEVRPR